MNVDISPTVPLVPAITSNHLGKIPAGLFLFCHNFVKKTTPFHTNRCSFGVAHLAAGGEGGSVIFLLAQCASWKGKISHSGAFVNRDSFGCCPGLAGTWRCGQHQSGMPTVWTSFHCLLSCPGLLFGISAPTCALSSGIYTKSCPGLCWHRSSWQGPQLCATQGLPTDSGGCT